MKAYRWSEALTSLILNLGAGWRWVVGVTIRPPSPSNPSTQWIGGWVNHRKTLKIFDKRKISCPFKNLNPVLLSLSLVQQLLYPGSFTLKGVKYWGADKSLARPGRKQTQECIRDARDFNNIETLLSTGFVPARQGAGGNWRHSDRNISLFPSWLG